MSRNELVWLHEEKTFATMVAMGAFMSLVEYELHGITYRVFVENDEFTLIEDDGFDYE